MTHLPSVRLEGVVCLAELLLQTLVRSPDRIIGTRRRRRSAGGPAGGSSDCRPGVGRGRDARSKPGAGAIAFPGVRPPPPRLRRRALPHAGHLRGARAPAPASGGGGGGGDGGCNSSAGAAERRGAATPLAKPCCGALGCRERASSRPTRADARRRPRRCHRCRLAGAGAGPSLLAQRLDDSQDLLLDVVQPHLPGRAGRRRRRRRPEAPRPRPKARALGGCGLKSRTRGSAEDAVAAHAAGPLRSHRTSGLARECQEGRCRCSGHLKGTKPRRTFEVPSAHL
mmetsp:Transcript_41253/g.117904  ORF Transcript_41253/g.117904 Transcript_41253/m.117904 type:complete len:283 (-) Transcript_41253:683-1531(-)